ncbi:hypothetical protein K503DRAFT_869249 [Rhizopogon vinicolor AM-OR11-026]|uniref:Tc1-like transposase DDE domain-containing protein n=1 Tax=Rhizopogon vinicolor AM-OR11-026 TaxID=1314800 RepID=A0A1B7MMT9_9AGAM|nr:hypothetical protein K503DRAFT_869249 [Rhizopogon vinicolor AM-OR11-026]
MTPVSMAPPVADSQLSAGLARGVEGVGGGAGGARTKDLAKGGKALPLSQVNQPLLIRNFATLRLKGKGRIAASLEIVYQWREEKSAYFARKIRAPWESTNCCMAHLLSQQEDFMNQPSMLETLIKKAGYECIFLPKFHCELNTIEMYWGWCKYRYREVPKKTFEDAKRCAEEQFDACPTEVIRRFIKRSWSFMSAYRLGHRKSTGMGSAEAKEHRQVSQRAMMSIEVAVLG